MITCPCHEHPFTSHFYVVKLGFTRVYFFFLNFALKHSSWILISLTHRGGSNEHPRSILSKHKKNITFFYLKITIFTAVKYCSILHGDVVRNVLYNAKAGFTERLANQI